jgi:hypothetical protein
MVETAFYAMLSMPYVKLKKEARPSRRHPGRSGCRPEPLPRCYGFAQIKNSAARKFAERTSKDKKF